jgi:hypothetical protein
MITKALQKRVLDWLAAGRSIQCTRAIVYWLLFGIKYGPDNHPTNAAEFQSCLELLDHIPELRGYLFRMAKLSPTWKRLMDEWESIEQTFRHEISSVGYAVIGAAPKANAMIREAVRT